MKKIKNSHSNAGQSTTEARKSHKHDANVQKNTTLYFQVGLILCLLAAHTLFEMRFENKIPKYEEQAQVANDNFEVTPPNYKLYQEQVADPEPVKKQKQLITKEITVIDNDTDMAVSNVITQEQNTTPDKPANIGDIKPRYCRGRT